MSGQTPGAPDPSMEDILASIRKILNEDEQAAATAQAAPAGPAPDGPVLLTADMMIAPPEPARLPAVEAGEGTARQPAPPVEPEPMQMQMEPEPSAQLPPLPPPEPPHPSVSGLVAPAAAAAAMAAFGQLSRAVAQDRNAGISRSGLSIEDVVREELRPLLKEWLDTHLPTITERLVRAEIERVMSRG
jgi:cell pole-organizing protein PopZ